MNDAAVLHPFKSAWDAPRPMRGRRGFIIAVTAIFAAHGLLVAYLYKSTFEPHYAQPANLPPVIATIVHPQIPPSSPLPTPQHSKPAIQPPHPRIAAPPPVDVHTPDPIPLPSVEKKSVADPQSPPHANEVKPHILTNPAFDRRPDADDLAQYYPERALRLEKEGSATIRCTVSAKGALVDCSVLSEEPSAFGFGEAALKLAKVFKLKPATADGTPVDGGIFSTKISFRLPG